METFLTVLHVVVCVVLVLAVLVQSGKGAEVSASFGGSSQTVFGSSGGANFFTKFTAVLAGVFMLTSIALTIIGSDSRKSVFESGILPKTTEEATPATDDSTNESAPADTQAE